MKRRIFWSILLTSFLVLFVTVSVVMLTVFRQFEEERKAEIKIEAGYVVEAFDSADSAYLSRIGQSSKNRLTLIAPDGTVQYDNFADAATMGNHADRPEIARAMEEGTGEATRASDTLGETTYYYAVRMNDGSVLRVAATMQSLAHVVDNTAVFIGLTVLLALVLSVVAARLLTRRIVEPINQINLDIPLAFDRYDELSPLLVRMDKQNEKIQGQLRELKEKQREFAIITDSMSEAMVIFSTDKKVLSANRSAKRLFLSYQPEGQGYPALCRDMPYLRTVEAAFGGRSAEEKLVRGGRIYRLSANPVLENEAYAAVLFAVDITEGEQAEQMRREFSANVSHELKTPLTSILGCAEIMQNGVAKPADFPHFIGQIYKEAGRLLSLIEDIIKLSRLDEGGLREEFVAVDLYALSGEVLAQLRAKAESAAVTMTLVGSPLCVSGIERTLQEMIYNLCDNAITYNQRGGQVTVSVRTEGERPVLSVKDTGIGIPPEHQSHVFERFYRVDKSRSKDTGGTGLGLSIVKHGALLHGAEIALLSRPGEGTEIRLTFQKQSDRPDTPREV